jgi:hypothetical protein
MTSDLAADLHRSAIWHQKRADEKRARGETDAAANYEREAVMLERSADIIDALDEVLAFLDDAGDVIDGAYGEPRPNTAMQLAQMLRRILEGTK